MELQLQNKAQAAIADLLWVADTDEEVRVILKVFGHDARVVYELMIAQTFDQVTDTDLAESALDKFRK